MPKYRTPSKRSKYYVPKEEYLTALHFCRQYPEWERAIAESTDQGNDHARLSNIEKKKATVDMLIHKMADGMDEWLFLGVCHGLTFPQMKQRGLPIGRTKYYEMRQRFYYYLAQMI